MTKPAFLPVFISTDRYASKEPAPLADCATDMIDTVLTLFDHKYGEDGYQSARQMVLYAVRLALHQMQANHASRIRLPAGVSPFDREATDAALKAAAGTLHHGLGNAAEAIADLMRSDAERDADDEWSRVADAAYRASIDKIRLDLPEEDASAA